MAIVLAQLPGGKELHELHERQPLRFFRTPPPRRAREAGGDVDDFGATTGATARRSSPMHDLTHVLDDVPLVGITDGWIGSAQIGVEAEFPRRAAGGGDMTHLLREAGDVPLRKKPSSLPFALQGGDAEDEDDSEDFASAEDDDGGEGAEDGENEDAETHLTEFIEAVAQDAAVTSKALRMLAQAFRQRKATSASLGLYG